MGNTFKTAFLLTALTLLLMGIGRAFGGQNGMLLALGVAAVTNFVAYFFSDKIALATYRAQPVTREQLPRVYEVVVFFSSRRRHTMYIGDWSSDVCSSDLGKLGSHLQDLPDQALRIVPVSGMRLGRAHERRS